MQWRSSGISFNNKSFGGKVFAMANFLPELSNVKRLHHHRSSQFSLSFSSVSRIWCALVSFALIACDHRQMNHCQRQSQSNLWNHFQWPNSRINNLITLNRVQCYQCWLNRIVYLFAGIGISISIRIIRRWRGLSIHFLSTSNFL